VLRYEADEGSLRLNPRLSKGTIVEVRVPSRANRPKSKARSVGDFAFYGMWKDRADIGDSVEYINNLRLNPRGLIRMPGHCGRD
jgi:hypothetical protein